MGGRFFFGHHMYHPEGGLDSSHQNDLPVASSHPQRRGCSKHQHQQLPRPLAMGNAGVVSLATKRVPVGSWCQVWPGFCDFLLLCSSCLEEVLLLCQAFEVLWLPNVAVVAVAVAVVVVVAAVAAVVAAIVVAVVAAVVAAVVVVVVVVVVVGGYEKHNSKGTWRDIQG